MAHNERVNLTVDYNNSNNNFIGTQLRIKLDALLHVPRQSLYWEALQLKCSVYEVMQNSIESMCLSYSALDWISWNWLITYYSFMDLKLVKWVKIVISAYERFEQSIFFSLCRAVVCLFVFSFLKQERHFEFQSYGGAWHRATLGSVNLFKIIQGISQV